jgi:large subunit ribosomal protein L10
MGICPLNNDLMAKSRQQKAKELNALVEKFGESKGVVFAQTMGLDVQASQELREKLREEGSEMVVAKKRLIGLMLEKAGHDKEAVRDMDGGIAVVFGYQDEVAPAKVVAEFAKDNEVVSLRGGILEGDMIDIEKVTELSKLPSKQELLAKLVGSLNSPLSGLVNVLNGPQRGLVQVLNQIKESKA